MAFDFSKLNFFSRLDARARVFVLFLAVIGAILLVYLGTRYLTGTGATTGPSQVAGAPQGVTSIQGGRTSPEYQRQLEIQNQQAATQAKSSGASAIPTMINYGAQQQAGGCIICADKSANIKTDLDDWVSKANVTPEVADRLKSLANQNVPVSDFAAELDRLVKEGKLKPEQARQLLETYRKQYAEKQLSDSGKLMDGLIQAGDLPLSLANELLNAQKNGMSPTDYAAMLQRAVKEGRLSPELARELLAQYSQQRAKEIIAQSIASLHALARAGQITADVEKALIDLENRMVPVDMYANTLQEMIASGKITPKVAAKILDEFKAQKAAIGANGTIEQLLRDAEGAAFNELKELLRDGKITKQVADLLSSMIQANVSLADYTSAVNELVKQKKLTPEIGKLKIEDYRIVKGLRDEAGRLSALQGNNATNAQYADELKRAVQAGILTPDQAARIMQEYQAITSKAPIATGVVTGGGTEAFTQLQKSVQNAPQPTQPGVPTANDFAAAAVQNVAESAQDRQARIDALTSAMSAQAAQLVSAWQPPTMQFRAGSAESDLAKRNKKAEREASKDGTTTTTTTTTVAGGKPLIKAGTILFGVLDTAVNSDYPDTPVLVTIVEGPFKGAKLLGKLTLAQTVAGALDRVSLNFTIMNMDQWDKTKSIKAFAIDPDTARTVLATDVNYHYLLRFGAAFATAFAQGYSQAIQTSASTTTTGIFGTSTTHPELSPGSKLAVALGQVGTTLGQATQNYINLPPTVTIDSGVGLGLLFMSDVI